MSEMARTVAAPAVEVASVALQQRAVKLLFCGGLDTVEIAAVLHCTEPEASRMLWSAPIARREPC